MSVGTDQIAINTTLEGVIQNEGIYYVSVRCRNGAGLETTYSEQEGTIIELINSLLS